MHLQFYDHETRKMSRHPQTISKTTFQRKQLESKCQNIDISLLPRTPSGNLNLLVSIYLGVFENKLKPLNQTENLFSKARENSMEARTPTHRSRIVLEMLLRLSAFCHNIRF